MTQTLYLGKLPATPENVKIQFSDIASTVQLPDPPAEFGHEALIKDWGMLGNAQAGCCYISSIDHSDMLWNAEAGVTVPFSDTSAIRYYQELTQHFNGVAYDPAQSDPLTGENPTDTGINVSLALPLLRNIGTLDDAGNRHKIGAYVKLHIDPEELRYAIRYFDGVLLGVTMFQEWQEAFQQGNYVWDAVSNPDATAVGGHAICGVAWRNGNPVIISWGEPVTLTIDAFEQSCDEVYALLTLEKLVNGVDLEGLDTPKLQDAIKQLSGIN